MSIEEFVEKMKGIQNSLLEFLEDESESEHNYEDFLKFIADQKVVEDKYEFKLFLRLISRISNNHKRVHNFIGKVERILRHFTKDIQNYFSNSEIFGFFKDNKRILLFLIQEKMIIIDEFIVSVIARTEYTNLNYIEYFAPEIKMFITDKFIQKYCSGILYFRKYNFIQKINKEIPDDFYEKRKIGENDSYLCYLIRMNMVKEFVIYVNQSNIPLNSRIEMSIYETNPFLMKMSHTIIQYASFFGSVGIIKYIKLNEDVRLVPTLWDYSIHSQNAEMIKYLEDNHVQPRMRNYKHILNESIKCYHNEISNYIIDNLIEEENLQNNDKVDYWDNLCYFAFKNDNYAFLNDNLDFKYVLFYLFEFDHYPLVKLFLQQRNIEINARIK